MSFELYGLNSRQQFLADILWQLEEWDQVEAFINTLPDREACECHSIVEMMRMALIEQCGSGVNTDLANSVIDKVRK
jgi:hypothetical protein